jgi:hypothetical protein
MFHQLYSSGAVKNTNCNQKDRVISKNFAFKLPQPFPSPKREEPIVFSEMTFNAIQNPYLR